MPLESFLQPIDDVQRPMWEEDRKRFLDIFEEVEISINGTAPFARFMKSDACCLAGIVDSGMSAGNFPERSAIRLMRFLYGQDMEWDKVKEICRENLHDRIPKKKLEE